MRTTLDDVARLAGVSRTTASRVLNGKGEVRPEIRRRVQEVIQQTGFRPLASAQSLVNHRTNLIGVALPLGTRTVFENSYFGELMTAIGRCAGNAGFSSALFLEEEAGTSAFIDRVVAPRRVDGIIVASYHPHDELIDQIAGFDIPVVTVGPSPYPHKISSVTVDDYQAGRAAAEHLIGLGRRRLGTITGPADAASAALRTDGFTDAAKALGVIVPDSLIAHGDYSRQSAEQRASDLIRHAPDAVFAASDQMALGFISVAESRGLHVPDDISVVGFDGVPASATSTPTLTTLQQPFDKLAQASVRILAGQLHDPEAVEHVVLSAELVVRDSSARSAL